MQAIRLPARHGWYWLIAGFTLFRRNPPLIGLVVLGYWMVLGLCGLFSLPGVVAATIMTPALAVGVAQACREVDAGRKPLPIILFAGFRGPARPLLLLGAAYFIATMTAFALTAPLDGGALLQLRLDLIPFGEAVKAPGIGNAVELASLLTVPLLFAFWYFPLLVAWHGQPLAKAVFFSAVACLRNWRAFLVYALSVLGVALLLPALLVEMIGQVFTGGTDLMLALLTVPGLFILAPALFASFYASYRDVFGISPAEPA